MDRVELLLKDLTEAHGVPGYEDEIRQVLKGYMEPLGKISQDKIGSLVCSKKGKGAGPRVMLAGHMDEIGFMTRHITEDGFVKFIALGGWWDQVLLGHRVAIKTHRGDVLGVVGAKPPHLLGAAERNKVVTKKAMYIDIGASGKEQVEAAGVRVGDPVVPLSQFTPLADPKTYMSKAFDNRIGCALVIEVLRRLKRRAHANQVFGVATVQEEVGVRGATTSVELVEPDVAIVLESDIAGDVPGIKPEESSTKMGGGPSILVYDARMIPNTKLRDLVIDTAAAAKIPLQVAAIEGGATDGAAIHLYKTGVPTVVLGVPTRHIHSHNAILSRADVDWAVELLVKLVLRLDRKTVAGLVP